MNIKFRIEWRAEAKVSFLECAEYIKYHSSEKTTKKWINRIEKSLKTLETLPEAGKKVGKHRVWLPHKNYKAYYEIREGIVYIVRFRHAKRKPLRYI
jgi:plasmid stabilization system protein ParE